jgi:hypothetical protein
LIADISYDNIAIDDIAESEIRTTDDRRPTTDDRRPTTDDRRPTTDPN